MRAVQQQAIDSGFLDLLGEDNAGVEELNLSNFADVLTQLAGVYIGLINENLDKKDASSSGRLSTSLKPTEVSFDGNIYKVGIKANEYLLYIDKGVNGWAKNKGGVYQFKTKGVNPQGEMVKSIKEYLTREGESARNVSVAISRREAKGIDALTKKAVQVSYLIKRFGIAPNYALTDATKEMEVIVKKELGAALKIDIINNLTK